MDITPIINAIIALIAALVSAFVIPWIKKKVAACDLDQMKAWTEIAVAAAEQLYTSLQGDVKKQYVKKYLAAKGYNINDEDIENTIEAEVLRLHNELYGTTKEAEQTDTANAEASK
jgi:tetrahydromethanopterin S-methyltransferase subunit C